LWYQKADDHARYDYIVTHVDDITIVTLQPATYMDMLNKSFWYAARKIVFLIIFILFEK
jgi:hypothetical protein